MSDNDHVAIDGLQILADDLEHRMLGRLLHFPADRCANCDVRRAVGLLKVLLATVRELEY